MGKRKRGKPRQAGRCLGINPQTDVRKAPLTRCKAKRAKNDVYCVAHGRQRERQTQLAGVLKTKWEEKLIGKRGAPTVEESTLPPLPEKVRDVTPVIQDAPAPISTFPKPRTRPSPFRVERPKGWGKG